MFWSGGFSSAANRRVPARTAAANLIIAAVLRKKHRIGAPEEVSDGTRFMDAMGKERDQLVRMMNARA